MSFFHKSKPKGTQKSSERVKRKLLGCGGSATIPLLNGAPCHILLNESQTGFTSEKLNDYSLSYGFEVFDIVEELLVQKGGKAMKGNGRGKKDKVGYGRCGLDTVVGYIAYNYSKKQIGDSTFDPVFVLAAILDWANIARNGRGYIELV